MTHDILDEPPGRREPNYFLWTMIGLLLSIAAVALVILTLD